MTRVYYRWFYLCAGVAFGVIAAVHPDFGGWLPALMGFFAGMVFTASLIALVGED